MSITSAGIVGIIASLIGLGFAWYQRTFVLSQPEGTDEMKHIAKAIQRGAQAFLSREYRAIGIFVAIVTVALLILSQVSSLPWQTALAFLLGALASGLAGYMGMYIAVRANVRTTQAASESLNKGLRVAFSSGTVMGSIVVSLALLGVSVLFIVFTNMLDDPTIVASALAGFGFGGTSIAIFARVGGGIYTKAADVGADLVGKTEVGIPEDDPRNPATIADNVGDNVGDVAGMGSDLFESYASSIIAAISLATFSTLFQAEGTRVAHQVFPILVAAAGIIIGIGASFLVRTEEGANQEQLLGSLRLGVYSASGAVVVAIIGLQIWLGLSSSISIATIAGLIGGVAIGYFTEYFTADTYKPTQQLSASAEGGTGIVIIRGLALGMMSTLAPVIVIVIVTLVAINYAGLYGVAIAAVGMLSTLGITLATDAYGPVADNAGGIAEMAHLPEEVRNRTDALDSLGNTTAATGKGFAIGSAAMTALALMAAFINALNPNVDASEVVVYILDAPLVTGFFIGAMLPYIFSALTMVAVGNAAQEIVEEVRRQFRELGIMEGKGEPDYERCVAISTDSAIREMILPGAIAVAVPVGIALITWLGDGGVVEQYINENTLIGVLIGSLISAFMLAVMMANAGGAWDNAKKYIEAGNYGGKGSEAHTASVVGDTVGDPFKDTSGPSLNILIKLLAIVSLVIAPLLVDVVDIQAIPRDGVAAEVQTIDEPDAEVIVDEATEEAAADDTAETATEDAETDGEGETATEESGG
ncbi:MAG: sodium-translocating pyrophosphatase [Anaerolineae bacterium]|nr:sodium-translocating pyrophosphatase [Anaerolineae bacterium]